MDTLTSEPSEWQMYNPNDWFTIYSHTYHCGHILHKLLYGVRLAADMQGGQEKWGKTKEDKTEMMAFFICACLYFVNHSSSS